MRFAAFLTLLSFSLIFSQAVFASDPVFRNLQWEARILVISGSDREFLYSRQLQILEDEKEGLEEREIVLIRFNEDNLYYLPELSVTKYRGWIDMDAAEQGYVEGALGIDNNAFNIALIGKDGEVKKSWTELEAPIPAQEIFEIIDAMPMRQREMKE